MKMKSIIISIFALAIVLMVEQGHATIDCGQVEACLAPCGSFLTQGGNPSSSCCSGIQNIKGMINTAQDKCEACNCMKTAAGRFPNLKDDAAQSLPDKCGVKLGIPISSNTNCNLLGQPIGLNCGQVESNLAPCVPYLTQGGTPSSSCCAGVKNIQGMAATTEDKRTACNCVKTAASHYPTLKDDAAQALPDKCGVKLDIPISRNTNCEALGQPTAGLNCGQIESNLAPCVPYLTQGGTPSSSCCAGVKNIQGMATSTEDKRAACNCVKTAAGHYPNLKDDAAQALPDKCGVKLDIPISRNTNCEALGQPAAGLNCGQIESNLAPCVPYLTQGGTPSSSCCAGVKNIQGMATSTEDKRAACNCVKTAAGHYPNLKDDAAQALPDKCGVKLDIPISRNTNCEALGVVGQPSIGLNCGQIESNLAPCVPYLTQGGTPSSSCCAGVKSIQGMASTTEDKRTACNCVKTAASHYPNLKDDAAQALPDKCGVKLDIPISRNTNCEALGQPAAGLNCGQIESNLAPCVPYLTQGGTPSSSCCAGVKNIQGMATSTEDKRAACNCVKTAAGHYPNLKDDAAQALPDKCGVKLDIPISRNTNCEALGVVGQPSIGLNCGQIESNLAPCVPYLTQGGTPSSSCCAGVKSIQGMASTTEDKRTACNCVKTAASHYPNLKDDAAQTLPDKCGVKLDIPISRNTNCEALGVVGQPSIGLNCGQIESNLAPCVPYLTQGGTPSSSCCAGVKNIQGMASTTEDKRTACNCVKTAASHYPNLKDDAAQALPDKCGVKLDIPISRNTNCEALGQPAAGLNCGQIESNLAPCVPYLTQGGTPSSSCCAGVKNIQGMATSTEDKRAACNCVKIAAGHYPNLKDDAAQALPDKCGVKLDIPISRNTNCEALGVVGQPATSLNCGQIESNLVPCVPYLTQGGTPSSSCCAGVKSIQGMAGTTEDKRTACNCVKTAASHYPNLKDDAAQALPDKCGVKLDIPISRNTNCEVLGQPAAMNCGQVEAKLAPCVPFLTQGGSPSSSCCAGLKNIQGMATTVENKRAACNCVKTAAGRYPNLKDDAAQALPDKCGVKLDIPISRNTNCEAIC